MENENNNQYSESSESKKFEIEKMSLETRKTIFIVSIVVIMAVIFGFWAYSIRNAFVLPEGGQNEFSDLGEITNEAKSLISGAKNGLAEITNEAKGIPLNTTSSDITQDQIKQLSNRINENEVKDWPVYINQSYKFSVSYPVGLVVSEIASSSDTIVAFLPQGTTTKAYELKKYSNYNEFARMRYLKNFWKGMDYYVVALDYLQSSTTELITNSFKFIDNN